MSFWGILPHFLNRKMAMNQIRYLAVFQNCKHNNYLQVGILQLARITFSSINLEVERLAKKSLHAQQNEV